jgi:hypothetical protein
MGPPSYMRSVVEGNVVMLHMTVYIHFKDCKHLTAINSLDMSLKIRRKNLSEHVRSCVNNLTGTCSVMCN